MVVAILRCVTIHTGINTDNKLKTTHTPKTNTNKAGCNNKPPSRLISDNSTSPLPNNHTRPSQTNTHENRYPKIPPKKTVKVQLDIDTRRKQRTYLQYERLYKERLISREEYLQAKEDYEVAQKKHGLITERLVQDSIYRNIQMDQMEDNLQNMRKNVLLIRERKEKLEVRATIDGELGLLDAELGQNITAGQMVGQINDLSDFKIEAMIDEHYIDRVTNGLPATFERQETTFNLKVRKVYPEVREGRFRTDFVFEGKRPDNIRSGQTYYIDLQLGEPTESVLIPKGTFFQVTGGNWIFVVDKEGKKAYRRQIRIGRQNPQYYEVLEGLEKGERVIVSGYESYKDNEVLILK